MAAPATLHACLEAGGRLSPHELAVRDTARDREANYAEFVLGVDRCAELLYKGGLLNGERLGICLPKSLESLAFLFAAQKLGAVHVPVDAGGPIERAAWIFRDCEVHTIICQTHRVEDLRLALEELGHRARIIGVNPDSETSLPQLLTDHRVTPRGRTEPATPRDPQDLAYILYTSGSTGDPKGVQVSQQAALAFIDWCARTFAPTPKDRFSSHAPFHFDLSILDIYVPLLHGASLHLIGEEDGKNPIRLCELLEDEGITCWYSTPSILSLMLDYGNLAEQDTSALRLVNFAGEVFPIQQLRRLRELLPKPEYWNLYGPTETNVCTAHRLPGPEGDSRDTPYPIGGVCAHYDSLIVDHDNRPVTPGEEGLLLIDGPGVMSGYWKAPQLDAQAFVEIDGRRWYNTGDVVRDPGDGELLFAGRRDRMVKKRGYRVELGEIEATLHRHEDLREVAVLARTNDQGEVRISACLATRSGERLSIIALKGWCAKNLLSYMIPDDFHFFDSLPKTSTDKTDYQGLKERLA